MKIDISNRGRFQILRIHEDLDVISDLSELIYLVRGYFQQGKRHVAVSFENSSYIYSGALAVLMECVKELKDGNGELCIIEPHDNLKEIFHILNIDRILKIYDSVDLLPEALDE